MKYDTSKIMRRAWAIYRDGMGGETDRDSFALALRQAWYEARKVDTRAVARIRRARIADIVSSMRPLFLRDEWRVA